MEEEKKDSKTINSRPAFIRVAPGAKVDDLIMINNATIGDADFINNQGELKNATLEDNKHIVPNNATSKKAWWKRPEIVIFIIIAVISIPWWSNIFNLLNEDPLQISVSDVQYELIDENNSIIHRRNWQDNPILNKDSRNIDQMLVSVKLKNPTDFQVFAKIENYNEIFANPYIVKSKGDFFDEMYSVPANGESGFIFAIDITPFTKIHSLSLSTPDEIQNIEFYNEKGEYIETIQANIANTYGMTIPYKVGIYNSDKELINTSNFEVLCRAKVDELKATLVQGIDRTDLSKALNFECVPVY